VAYLAEIRAQMPHVPAPPADCLEAWSRVEIDLYYGSGGLLRPPAATLAQRKSGNANGMASGTDFHPSAHDLATARQRATERNYGSLWLAVPQGQARPTAAVRLFIFGHTGSAPSFWFPMMKAFEDSPAVEAIAVQLPGRGARMREPILRRCSAIAAAFLDDAGWLLNAKPYLCLGHSFGCAVMYYVAVEASRRGVRLPFHMIFSSRPSIEFEYKKPYYRAPESEIVEFMKEVTPPELLANKEMMDMILPIVRGDYEANETATLPLPEAPVLPVPFTLCTGGPRDKTPVDPPMCDTILGWKAVTSGPNPVHYDRDGGHYWLKDDPGRSWLVNLIKGIAAGAPP
jgi:medium-chain acyl-[acyl-carrier-protein] hydrolase